ncbi:EXLDI protein [Nocardia sp. CA-107356]|uniref:EXLDI protein n=1 Tax=Nocardia sp. CA-107356 TaxID=3239972 RepID=UPI003D8ECF7B
MTTDPNPPTGIESSAAVVDVTKTAPGEFQEIQLEVGPGGGRKQRFQGRLLGEAREYTKVGVELIRVYLSRKGKYVVHRRVSEWSDFAATIWITDWKKNWREIFEIDDRACADYTVEIVESFEDLALRVPAKIYRSLVDVTEHPQTEDLDI